MLKISIILLIQEIWLLLEFDTKKRLKINITILISLIQSTKSSQNNVKPILGDPAMISLTKAVKF